MTTTHTQPAGRDLDSLRDLIANDGFAMSFQSMGQYRAALIAAARAAQAPQSGRPEEQAPFADIDAFEDWFGRNFAGESLVRDTNGEYSVDSAFYSMKGFEAGIEYALTRAAQAPQGDTRQGVPELAIELVGVREAMAEGGGFWTSCSGCHDTEDGHPTGPYSYSSVFGCALGSGCSECGGIGAVWDNTDYDAMAAELGVTETASSHDQWCALCGGTGGHGEGCKAPEDIGQGAHTCAPADERATSCSPSCFWGDCPPCVEARAAQGAGTAPVALEPVEGDLLPPVGSKVLIHLARQDAWVEHTVSGYYVWGALRHQVREGEKHAHRVFVRVKDANGYDNARLLSEVRPATHPAPVSTAAATTASTSTCKSCRGAGYATPAGQLAAEPCDACHGEGRISSRAADAQQVATTASASGDIDSPEFLDLLLEFDGSREAYDAILNHIETWVSSRAALARAPLPGQATIQPTLMRQAVASVVSRSGNDLRIGWLRPERCDVGTLLYCAVEPSRAQSDTTGDRNADQA